MKNGLKCASPEALSVRFFQAEVKYKTVLPAILHLSCRNDQR